MIRPALAAFAALTLLAGCGDKAETAATSNEAEAATRAAPAGRDWTQVAVQTPEGGFRVGNPGAKLKLIEYASLTCSHCKTFHTQSHAELMQSFVKPGRVSYEYRNFILNGPDLAMSLLARCQGAQTFFPLLDAVYGQQEQLLAPFTKADPAAQARIQAMPAERQIIGLADQGRLDQFFKLRGVPRAKYEACLTDQAGIASLQKLRDDGIKQQVNATPTFLLNGETLPGTDSWAPVKSALQARL